MQQFIAIAIVLFFIFRLSIQKRKNSIGRTEFYLWLFFWLISASGILFIKKIDNFVAYLGFSSSGIDVLLYLAIAVLFYLLFRIRIKMEKIEKDITTLVRKISINDK